MERKELIELDKEILIDMILSLQKSVDELLKNNELLLEALRISKQKDYGKKSEVNSADQLSLELFFNEAESTCDTSFPEPELKQAAPRKKKTRGRKQSDLLKITDHREESIELSDSQLDELFGRNNYKRLPDEIIQKLEHIPAKFEAVTYRVAVYCAKDDSKCDVSIVRAKAPGDPFPKSIATPSLVSSIITAKYVNGVPLYRQEKAYEQNNVFINRTNMANWIISSYDRHLYKLMGSFKKELLKSDIIHADETTLRCSKDCKDRQKNYMWVYHSSDLADRNRVTIFEYEKDRKAEHPKEYLEGYKGTLVCDGYSAYKGLDEDIKIAGCWVHTKRKFADYVKALGKDKAKDSLAYEGVNRISKIFHEEHKLDGLDPKDRLDMREKKIKPLVDEFFQWVRNSKDLVPPKSQTGKAFSYALNQEEYLRALIYISIRLKQIIKKI